MAEYTVQKIANTGLKEVLGAVTATDTFFNDGYTQLHVKNASGAAVTVTVKSPTLCNHGFTHDIPVSIPAGEERYIGPFDTVRHNDVNGKTTVTYSATASVTAAALRLG